MLSGYDYSSKMFWNAQEVQKTAEGALWWKILSFKNEKNKIQGTPVGKKLKSLYLSRYFKKEWKIQVKTTYVNTQLIVLTCNVYALKYF